MERPSVQDAYDLWSETYDECQNATRDLDAVVMRAQPFDLTGANVVEVGCGTGKNTEWLARGAAAIVALDLSEKMLDVARRRVPSERVRFIEHDIRDPWPVPEGSADLVTCNLVLEHIEDVRPVFAQARRSMRPAGVLFLSELHPFRQLLGKHAHFADASANIISVPAFLHDVSTYVGAGLAEGLRLTQLSEWRDEGATASAPPRLLTLTFVL